MTPRPFDLRGKVAIVTGGNGGIGLGMARGLAEAGASIAIVGAMSEVERSGRRPSAARRQGGLGDRRVTDKARRRDDRADGTRTRRIDISSTRRHQYPQSPQRSRSRNGQRHQDNLTSAFLCSQAVYPHEGGR